MDTTQLQNQINDLKRQLEQFQAEFYRNNFTANQDFNKFSNFTTHLKVPSYSSLPATCQVGEIAESGGVLKICSALNTWSSV